MNALISFYLKIEPTELSDEDFVIKYNQVRYCLDLEDSKLNNQLNGS